MLLYIGVNEDGFVSFHTEAPKRDNKRGVWYSNSPFCSSVICDTLEAVIRQAGMTWKNDVEIFDIPVDINHPELDEKTTEED